MIHANMEVPSSVDTTMHAIFIITESQNQECLDVCYISKYTHNKY